MNKKLQVFLACIVEREAVEYTLAQRYGKDVRGWQMNFAFVMIVKRRM
ncbi:hypothetical protein GFC30_312 [Anoxybacillus amylolyticus]|uniref:Uncharacterized protein n=1 Tax=Anoxybacteroides amylolyticum TaxID=294699 RepID=A0A160F404_9BACL|nr:hypothetical protein GFC30_312 [Anoxybacillus amylolyticus]